MLTKTFKLGVACPNTVDGTSLMRGVGPLAAMSRQERKLELVFPKATQDGGLYLGWDWLAQLDGLFLQRPQSAFDVSAAQTAKSFGLPVWVDFDDDLSSVPESNEYRRRHDPQQMQQIMARCWALADVVTVTVEALRERLLENSFGGGVDPVIRRQLDANKIRVVPNALHWPLRHGPRTRRVVWRGGKSHDADLMAFLPAIKEVARMPQFSQWEWHFMGEMSAYVQSAIVAAIPAENLRIGFGDFPHQYIAALGLLCPWLVMVPLEDNTFNRCKSPLAWIEASASGATCLAPDWASWNLPGALKYAGREDFAEQLRLALMKYTGVFTMTEEARMSRQYIENYLTLAETNKERWKIIQAWAK
jgi:hypothetical protein